MNLLQKIKKKFADRKFNRTLGEHARIKGIAVMAYNDEMKKQLELRATAKGKQKAKRHVKSFWKRRKFILQSSGAD